MQTYEKCFSWLGSLHKNTDFLKKGNIYTRLNIFRNPKRIPARNSLFKVYSYLLFWFGSINFHVIHVHEVGRFWDLSVAIFGKKVFWLSNCLCRNVCHSNWRKRNYCGKTKLQISNMNCYPTTSTRSNYFIVRFSIPSITYWTYDPYSKQ